MADTPDLLKQLGLFFVHLVLSISLIVFMANINKAYNIQQEKWKSLLSAAVNESNVDIQEMCVSSFSNDMFKKFQFSKDLIFGVIFTSFIVNLIYLALVNYLPKENWVKQFIYGPLFLIGFLSMGYAVDGYIKIISFTREPIECQKMFNDLKTFFIISIIASVLQSFLSIWIIISLYNVSEKK